MNLKYSKEILEKVSKESSSISDVVRKITGKEYFSGSSHALVARKLKEFKIDISHFTGNEQWKENFKNKKQSSLYRSSKEILIFDENKKYREKTHLLKRALITEGKLYQCEDCGVGEVYNNKPLTLQIDHIDGNWKNNLIENLRFLCPNCHSQTETYGYKGKN